MIPRDLPEEVSASTLPLLRMLALQRWLGLSDAELVAEVEDRLSLRRFCGFGSSDSTPSIEALAAFRSRLDPEPLVSVVSPVYRAPQIVDELVRRVTAAVESLTSEFEIVLVEDGSGDGTWDRIAAACAADRRVKGIKLSRNFGQHRAITAGLEHARGKNVVVMDCDLQDDPAFIPDLYAKSREGFDVVLTSREEREHGFIRRAFAWLFNRSLTWAGGAKPEDWHVGSFSILSRRAVDALLRMGDVHRHYLGLVNWVGFSVARMPVPHRPRFRGRSSYDVRKLIRHAVDGWVSSSNRLLYVSVAFGFSFMLAALAGMALVIALYFIHGFAPGWPSLVVLILASTGSLLLSVGVLGLYIGKIFDQVRARPLYLIERTLNTPPSGR